MKRKHYTKQEKAKIVLEILREEKTTAQIASEYGVHPTMLGQWKKAVLEGLPELFEPAGRTLSKVQREHEEEKDCLFKKIGQLEIEVDWLKKKSEQIMLNRRTARND